MRHRCDNILVEAVTTAFVGETQMSHMRHRCPNLVCFICNDMKERPSRRYFFVSDLARDLQLLKVGGDRPNRLNGSTDPKTPSIALAGD